jgi:hypothetical protein
MRMRLAIASMTATSCALALTFTSSAALAQGCPPGSWFCADGQAAAPSAPAPVAPAAAPAAPAPPIGANPSLAPLPPAPAAGTTVIVNNGTPAAAPSAAPAPAPAPGVVFVPVTKPWPVKEWGLNVHIQGAMMGKRSDVRDAGMGGLGGALRYRPSRSLALEGSLDLYGGQDYAGQNRGEVAFSLGGYLYMSPLSRTQPYFTGGIGWAYAGVNQRGRYASAPVSDYTAAEYTYFGGYIGFGGEHRMSRNLALNADIRGFVRGRTDKNVSTPEFVSLDGRATNTSGGFLLNLGATLYF